MQNINSLAAEVHVENARWWRDLATGQRIERNRLQTLFLIVSEIVEAGEGERKGLLDDHLTHRHMAEVEMADATIRLLDYVGAHNYDLDGVFRRGRLLLVDFLPGDNRAEQLMKIVIQITRVADLELAGCPHRDIELQLAGVLAMIEMYCDVCDYDLNSAIVEKRAYNKTRADHTDAARLAAGGKKW